MHCVVTLQTEENPARRYGLCDIGGRPQAAVSVEQAIGGWERAAAAAGAHLPAAVADVLMEYGRQRPVSRAEVVEALYEAADRVRDECDVSLPVPRGMMISLDPSGGLRLEWGTEGHLITFYLPADSFRRGHLNPVNSWASVECRHEGASVECYRVVEFLAALTDDAAEEAVV